MLSLENVAKIIANTIKFEVHDTLRDKSFRVACLRNYVNDSIEQVVIAFNDQEFEVEIQQKTFDKNENITFEKNHLITIKIEIDKDSAIDLKTNEPVDPEVLKKEALENASRIWITSVFQEDMIQEISQKIKKLIVNK